MKVIPSSILLFLTILKVSEAATFKPYQIPYDDLIAGHVTSGLLSALQTSGMVAISDMGYMDSNLLKNQASCLSQEARQVIQAEDGTLRYTLASKTTVATGPQELLPHDTTNEACVAFTDASANLRVNVQAAVHAFAAVLDLSLPGEEVSFTDLVEHGTHLEHFHSYIKAPSASEEAEAPPTLDWHVDQGVFLAFMPGRYANGEITKGFYIQNADGVAEEVDFGGASLVFMLGDGVHRYVHSSVALRPVHHALRVPTSEEARLWFGLMVLPPTSALSPEGHTFGDIRQGLLKNEPSAFALGCSDGSTTAVSGARFLEGDEHKNHNGTDTTAVDSSVTLTLEELNCPAEYDQYCWHRCMNLTEYDLTYEKCSDQGMQVSCLNPRGEVSDGDSHGDFFLGCASADTPAVTPFPTLPDYPRDEDVCDGFDAFVDSETYEYAMALNDGDGAVLQWNVVTTEGSEKMIDGRLAFNGIFGYLAIGKSGEGGRNKMYNAPVIMALRGSNYEPETGFELETEPAIEEFMTSIKTTSYRFWTPMGTSDDAEYSTTNDDCYTALKFKVSSIAGEKLNIAGKDEMIWGANNVDTFAQYHGKNRAVFEVEWEGASFLKSASTNREVSSSKAIAVIASLVIMAVAALA